MNADDSSPAEVSHRNDSIVSLPSSRRQSFVPWCRVAIGVVVVIGLAVLLAAIALTRAAGEFRANAASVEAYLRAHQDQLMDAVQETIAKTTPGETVACSELPVALRADQVLFAVADADHVTLTVSRNPDTDRGYRVWLKEQSAEYDDAKTDIAGVYAYSYCDDYEESPSNRPH